MLDFSGPGLPFTILLDSSVLEQTEHYTYTYVRTYELVNMKCFYVGGYGSWFVETKLQLFD